MPPNYRQASPEPVRTLSPRERRTALVLGALMLLTGAGVGAWELAKPGSGGNGGRLCVSIVVPSSTGGATLTYCGRPAKTWCAAESERPDALGTQAEAACRRKGLWPNH